MAEYKMKCSSVTTIKVEDIIRIEEIVGYKFPKSYTNFVETNNGGTVDFEDEKGNLILAHINIESWGPSSVTFIDHALCELYGSSTFEGYYKNSRDILPNTVIPIAFDAAGNYYLLCYLDEASEPSIYFQDHEETTSIDELDADMLKKKTLGEYQREGMEFVANTFSDFLSLITPDIE